MWNPFKKKQVTSNKQQGSANVVQNTNASASSQNRNAQASGNATGSQGQPQNMGMLQRLAMKKLMSMSESERRQLMDKFMAPENISKNKDKIIAQMDQMKKSGMLTEAQYEEGKKRLGL